LWFCVCRGLNSSNLAYVVEGIDAVVRESLEGA